jgi:hypothetical protein
MARKQIISILSAYFLAAWALAFVEHSLKPFAKWNSFAISYTIGTALGLYILSGIFPLIGWAFGKFSAQKARPILIAWGLIGLILGAFQFYGTRLDDYKIIESTNVFYPPGKAHDDFIQQVKMSCIDTQSKASINQQLSVTTEQIESYCSCYADNLLRQVSNEELKAYVRNGAPPDSMKGKIQRIGATCGQSIPHGN